MFELTPRQKQILQYIQRYVTEKDFSPSIREIARQFKITAHAVAEHLDRLARAGALEYVHSQKQGSSGRRLPRGIRLAEPLRGVPLLGRVPAGHPFHAEENVEEYIEPNDILPQVAQHFALRVKGDSMIGAGILEGDIVIVRKQDTAQNGELVVALIEGEATVKKYVRTAKGAQLEPANPKYGSIQLVGEVHLAGKVVRVLRRY
jgi:repressor LexA